MADEIVTAWHFTGDRLRDRRPIPPAGEWLRHEGRIEICVSGFHASVRGYDALNFAPGGMLHRVELRGDIQRQNDKLVARERRILWSADATETLRAFSRAMALKVIHLWDAPAIVKQYLETGDEGLRAAAWAAARAAAWAAARAAAWDAAWDATWDATWAAAWAAARAAAWDAAWAAARAAAWAAARDATWDATWDAFIEEAAADLEARFLALEPQTVGAL